MSRYRQPPASMVLRVSCTAAGSRQALLRGRRRRLGLTGGLFNTEDAQSTEEHRGVKAKGSGLDGPSEGGCPREGTISDSEFDISESEIESGVADFKADRLSALRSDGSAGTLRPTCSRLVGA